MSQRLFALGFLYFPSSATKQFLLNSTSHQAAHPSYLLSCSGGGRNISTKHLTPTISFYTATDNINLLNNNSTDKNNNNKQNPPSPPSLSCYPNKENRPLSILLCWLMAKNNAVNKYAQFYLDQGYDVLTVRITPWNLLWPSTCVPIIENELLPLLQSSIQNYETKIIHGFSVGGYIFGQLLKYFHKEPEKYQELLTTIKVQIWDSPVDVNGVAVGVSKSIFLNSAYLQKLLENYIVFHMNLFYSVATKYYEESHEYFYHHPIKAPALFLCSKMDLISTIDKIYAVQNSWKPIGINCSMKCWENTKHVGHMHKHPEEYKQVIKNFLQQHGDDNGQIGGIQKKQGRIKPEFATVLGDDNLEEGIGEGATAAAGIQGGVKPTILRPAGNYAFSNCA